MQLQAAFDISEQKESCFRQMMAHARGQGNDDALARIHASRMYGSCALPAGLGLAPQVYAQLMDFHFPGYPYYPSNSVPDGEAASFDRSEIGDLIGLMLGHRAGVSPSEEWMAGIVATACMANDHLWQDLGLWNRQQLTQLMQRNFPALAGKNVHNMKWKKFLYKQLCSAEGIYVCRAPSCAVCADYNECFGPED